MLSLRDDETGPLARLLGSLGPGDLILHLRGVAETEASRERLKLETLPAGEIADVAILVRSVRPASLR